MFTLRNPERLVFVQSPAIRTCATAITSDETEKKRGKVRFDLNADELFDRAERKLADPDLRHRHDVLEMCRRAMSGRSHE